MSVFPPRTWYRLAWLAGDVVVLSVLALVADAVLAPFFARLVTGAVGVVLYVVTENNW